MTATIRTALAAAALFAATQAAAVSLGDTVTCDEVGPGIFVCDVASAVVAAGPEFALGTPGNAFFTVDFSPGLVRLQGLQDGTLAGTILEFTNLTSAFTSASFRPSAWDGYSFPDDVSLAGGVLTIDLIGTAFNASSFIEIGLTSGGVIPEPGTWAMLIAGFGLVGAMARRRTATAARAA
jgi:hypothetical protein